MKKLGIAIAVVAGIGFIAPKFVGDVVENKYQETLAKLASHPSITITESQFSRNWFSGVSVVKITPSGDLAELENFVLTIKEDINFGPFIFDDSGFSFNLATSSSHFSFDKNTVPEEFATALNEKLSLTSKVTYGMDYVTNIHLKEIFKEQDGNSFRVGEMQGQLTLSDDKYMTGEINWNGLNFNGPQAVVSISGAKIELDQEVISGDFYSGNAVMTGGGVFSIPEVMVKTPAKVELFSLTDLAISGRSEMVDELIEMTINYNVKDINAQGQNFKNANLNIIFKNLDADVLTELNTMLAQISANASEQEAAMKMQEILTVASKLLAHNPEIEISDFSVETPEGLIKSDMLMSIDNTIYDPANPMSLIASLKANAKGNAPEPFFEKLGMKPMLDMYVDQGLIVRKNSDLSFTVQFEQGKLTVNGNVLPL